MITITTGITTCLLCTELPHSCSGNTYINPPLITPTYREGAGDNGYTTTGTHQRGEKYNYSLIDLWTALGKLQTAIALTSPLFIDRDTQTYLRWVWENVRSLSSLAYLKGESKNHCFPVEATQYMESIIRVRKSELGPTQSFIQWESKDLLQMEVLWSMVRETEVIYRRWHSTTPIEGVAKSNMQTVLTFLNRLSSYLWWSMRHENKLRGDRELIWQGQVTPFPFPTSTHECI